MLKLNSSAYSDEFYILSPDRMLLYYTTLNTDSDIVHVLDEVMANLKKTVYTELLVSELKLWQLQKVKLGLLCST